MYISAARENREADDRAQGFFAKPQKDGDSLNLMQWDIGIPGKEGVRWKSLTTLLVDSGAQTPWEGGVYKVVATFPEGARAASSPKSLTSTSPRLPVKTAKVCVASSPATHSTRGV
jgi:hypothetical protein